MARPMRSEWLYSEMGLSGQTDSTPRRHFPSLQCVLGTSCLNRIDPDQRSKTQYWEISLGATGVPWKSGIPGYGASEGPFNMLAGHY